MADIATIRAICAYWRTIGEKKKVSVCGHLITTFCAFEAVDMEKGLTTRIEKEVSARRQCTEMEHTQKLRRGRHAQ